MAVLPVSPVTSLFGDARRPFAGTILDGMAQQPPSPGGVLGALGQLFGGFNDPNLSPEQNEQARRQAMLMAGLQGLVASQGAPGMPTPGLLPILAQSALVGQQAGAVFRQQAAQQAAQQALQQRFGSIFGEGPVGREQLRQAFAQAVAAGDVDSARAISTVIQAVEASERPRSRLSRPEVVRDPNTGERIFASFDPETGRFIPVEGARPLDPTASTRLQAPREVVIGGRRMFASFDPETGRFVPIEGAEPVPEGPSGGTQDERKAAAFLEFAPAATEFIDTLERAPGRIEQALSKTGIREFTDAEQQQLVLYGNALAEAWLRMTTGAAYNQTEFQTAFNLFVPQPGDRKETLDAKRANRRRLIRMLRIRAGLEAGGDVQMRDPQTGEVVETPTVNLTPEDGDALSPYLRR